MDALLRRRAVRALAIALALLGFAAPALARAPKVGAQRAVAKQLVRDGHRPDRVRCRGARGRWRCSWRAGACSGRSLAARRHGRWSVRLVGTRCRVQRAAPIPQPLPARVRLAPKAAAPAPKAATPAVSAPPAPPPLAVGFNDNAIRAGAIGADADAALTARVGATVHRVAFDWRTAEPQRDRYQLAEYDRIYRAMLARGVRPLFIVTFAPRWTWEPGTRCSGDCRYPPGRAFDGEWRQIAALLASRYPRAAGIEIWNEPNLKQFWQGGVDPARYAELLRSAYQAAKAANPSMTVVGGALSNLQVTGDGSVSLSDFLRGVYANGGGAQMDAISLHPYPWSLGMSLLVRSVQQVRAVRDAYGDGAKPLWLTELGLSTTGRGAHLFTEDEQARGLVTMYRTARQMPDVRAIVFHTLLEPTWVPGASEAGFGVVRSDLSPKPAYCALALELGRPGACP
jgi:hypothetical protein